MTPALFLIPELAAGPPPVGGVVELTGAEARHAATVKRLVVCEVVLLADGVGTLIDARATSVGRDRILFEVLACRSIVEPDPRLVVIQALPKGERADLAVEALTELGADEIVPWSAQRSVSQWRGVDKISRGRAKWQRTALEAGKQSRRARLPVIGELASTADVVQRIDRARGALPPGSSAAVAVVLHEAAEAPLAGLSWPTTGELLVIIGPEGGVAEEELAQFRAAGAAAVRLGPEVLRTSTAGAAVLAVLSVALGRWR
ncbi:16S rRNA (uracil(1498)-N(3))-methyltransferase [soil metagenome]